jgi:hypothetical protein
MDLVSTHSLVLSGHEQRWPAAAGEGTARVSVHHPMQRPVVADESDTPPIYMVTQKPPDVISGSHHHLLWVGGAVDRKKPLDEEQLRRQGADRQAVFCDIVWRFLVRR